jgi:Gluconate 2-dehydrogenase subunit 3
MRRRDFVKAIVAVPISARTMLGQQADTKAAPHPQEPVAPAAPPRGLSDPKALITSSVPDAVATTQAHFFNEQQMATLRKLADILMCPPKGYPGASEAGALEFIDFLIGTSPDDRKQMYQAGLDRLNADAEKQFHVSFAQVNAEQADKLIGPWLRTWAPNHPPTEPFARFINLAHHDIRTATMNSQAWSTAATSAGERAPGVGMYWSPIDPDLRRYV